MKLSMAWTSTLIWVLTLLSVTTFAQTPPSPTPPAATPPSYYYFCSQYQAYYPNVKQCPQGWTQVPLNAPTPQPQAVYVPVRPWRVRYIPLDDSEHAVVDRPNALTIELGGRGWAYSLDYDRAISDHFTLGLGASSWQATNWWGNYSANVTVVPVYTNFYFTQDPNRGFLSAGADFVSVSENNAPNGLVGPFGNSVAATVGGGFESRSNSGFIYRIDAFVIAGKGTALQPAFSLGYAF